MSTPHGRRRFLTDLLFAGGVVAVSAGLAFVGTQALSDPAPAPPLAAQPTPEITPVHQPPTPEPPQPVRVDPHYNAMGESAPPRQITAGGRRPHTPPLRPEKR